MVFPEAAISDPTSAVHVVEDHSSQSVSELEHCVLILTVLTVSVVSSNPTCVDCPVEVEYGSTSLVVMVAKCV